MIVVLKEFIRKYFHFAWKLVMSFDCYQVFYVFFVCFFPVSHQIVRISLFHRAFFNSIMDKTPTHALFT